MKKHITIITILTALLLPAYAAFAGTDMKHMNSEFKEMDNMMKNVEKSTNKNQRQKYMNTHMKMMMKQMDSMENMMSESGKPKGSEMHDSDDMKIRMDVMQKMMEHMLRQQNMMMENMK